MTQIPVLTTTHLRLRPRSVEDVEACWAMDIDFAVHRYIWPEGIPDVEAHRETIRQRFASGWPPVGGVWVVEWQDKPGFLGWCGLFPLEESGLIEIGYRYVQRAWGQGVATEAAREVLDYGFRALEIDPIVAVTDPENRASQNVLRKIGLRQEGTAFHYGRDLSFFRLERAQYVTATKTDGPDRAAI